MVAEKPDLDPDGCFAPQMWRRPDNDVTAPCLVTPPAFPVPDRLAAGLERVVRELRQANAILRKASAYFAQAELERPFRK